MSKRMKYRGRSKYVPADRRSIDLERQASHMILQGDHAHQSTLTPDVPEGHAVGARYRSIGSVLQIANGKWMALDGQGEVVGIFLRRDLAWKRADLFGVELIA